MTFHLPNEVWYVIILASTAYSSLSKEQKQRDDRIEWLETAEETPSLLEYWCGGAIQDDISNTREILESCALGTPDTRSQRQPTWVFEILHGGKVSSLRRIRDPLCL